MRKFTTWMFLMLQTTSAAAHPDHLSSEGIAWTHFLSDPFHWSVIALVAGLAYLAAVSESRNETTPPEVHSRRAGSLGAGKEFEAGSAGRDGDTRH